VEVIFQTFKVQGIEARQFLGKKIKGLQASLRFEDLEIIKFQGGLKIGVLE